MSEQTQKDDKSKKAENYLGDVVIEMVVIDGGNAKIKTKSVANPAWEQIYLRPESEAGNFPKYYYIRNPIPNNHDKDNPHTLMVPYLVTSTPPPPPPPKGTVKQKHTSFMFFHSDEKLK